MTRKPSEAKRRAVLAAAAQSFVEHGYDRASMDAIAQLAGVSKRTVYNHFSTKELLFGAVISDLIDRAGSFKALTYCGETPLENQILPLAKFKIVLATDPNWSGLLRLIFGMALRAPEFAKTTAEQLEASDLPLVQWLTDATVDGRMNVPDPERSAKMFGHMAAGVLFWPTLFGRGVPEDKVDETAMELVNMFLSQYRC